MPYDTAKIAEMTYTALQTYNGIILDHVDPPWDGADSSTKTFFTMVADFFLRNPTADEKYCHELYFILKTLTGWTYDPVYDEATKKSPMIAVYETLSAARKLKYQLVKNVILGNKTAS